MTVRVTIPSQLQKFVGEQNTLAIAAHNIANLLDLLDEQWPELRSRLRHHDGKLHRFVNLYVNQEDIRFLSGLNTVLNSGDEVSIVPAVAGG